MELNRQTAMSLEVVTLNKNFSVFFSLVPRIYYVLPWRYRLVPMDNQSDEYLEEIAELDEE